MALERRYTNHDRRSNHQFSDPPRPLAGALEVTGGEPFGSGYSDDDLRARAETEGKAQLYTEIWGENRPPYPMHEIVDSAGTTRSLQGHEMDAQRRVLEEEMQDRRPNISFLESTVITKIGDLELARCRKRWLEQTFEAEQLQRPQPQPGRRWLSLALMAGLAAGELYLLSPAFQVLGLSDQAFVGWLAFNPQNLAALSSVVGLLTLAHASAKVEPTEVEDEEDPSRAWRVQLATSSAGHRILMLAIAALLIGLATVREAYLAATDKGNLWIGLGFVLLNLGMVIAARSASRPDSRPYAAEWRSALDDVATAEEDYSEIRERYDTAVGGYNNRVVAREALFSQYGHALAATGSDAERQVHLTASHTRLSQPEPVTERMFDDQLPTPSDSQLQADVRAYLLDHENVEIPFRRYKLLKTTAVTTRYQQMEEKVATYEPPAPLPVRRAPAPPSRDTAELPLTIPSAVPPLASMQPSAAGPDDDSTVSSNGANAVPS